MILMPDLFSFAYVPNWYSQLDMLAEMALPEPWRFKNPIYLTKNPDTPILERYIHAIFKKQLIDYKDERNPSSAADYFHIENEFCCFHTGLYGRCKLEDAFAAVNIKGRHGANMGGNSIVDLICNEKIVGDMLLQKTFVVDPITKEVRKNNGEKPQYFVEGSHEGILDRKTYEKVLAERARRAAAYKPRSGSYERNRFPFSGKIHCGKCGKSFTRKVLNGNTPYEKRGWLCRTFNQKGKAHCDAKQIPEEILKRVSAEAMGLPEFDEAAFAAKVEEIQVPENGVLVFVFYDGHTVTKTWDNPSRRHSWNPENRQRARELALRQAAERRLAKCQQ